MVVVVGGFIVRDESDGDEKSELAGVDFLPSLGTSVYCSTYFSHQPAYVELINKVMAGSVKNTPATNTPSKQENTISSIASV